MNPALIAAAAPLVQTIIDRAVPDPEAKARAEGELSRTLLDLLGKADAAQIDVNRAEAGHPSLFVAGWRPFVGWVCGAAVAWHFVGLPVAAWASTLWFPGTPLPQFRVDDLWELIAVLLGVGGLRTFEKLRGVARG